MAEQDDRTRALVVEISLLAAQYAGWVPDEALFGLLESRVPFESQAWADVARALDHAAGDLAPDRGRRLRDIAARIYHRATASRV